MRKKFKVESPGPRERKLIDGEVVTVLMLLEAQVKGKLRIAQ